MNQGGIAKRLVDFVLALLGKLPGALLVTNVGANALFGAISGSASAAAAAVGSMVREGEDEQGYDKAVCAATNGASAPSGLLIPPSNALITYSLVSGGTSVAALFLAGYIPGLLWTVCCLVVAVIIAKKKGYQGTPGKFDWKNLFTATMRAIPALSLIVVVIGGIIAGVFTATEGSAIAVVYALILGIFYRNITWKSFWKIVVDSAKMSGMIVFLIGVSGMGYGIYPDSSGDFRSAAWPDQQPDHHSPDYECDSADCRYFYGCNSGDSDFYALVPSYLSLIHI